MIPWTQIDSATMPDGGGELRLMRRGDEFSIMAGAIELMNSRLSGSEEALAEMACARMGARTAAHVLVGGLGMGFTLRAALNALGPDATVTVAELVPAVVAWARGATDALGADAATYVNFTGEGSEDRVRAAYPKATYERLVTVKDEYDPTNLFRLNQNIPPSQAA